MKSNYTIKEVSEVEFKPLYEKHREQVFADDHSYMMRDILSDAELASADELRKACAGILKIRLAAFDESNNFIGWSWGFQENSTTFYMCNSGVVEGHRRKGVYHDLVNKMIDITSKKGFQLIYSRHCLTNNAVIIPKLKAGFTISKMEMSDNFGVMIHLHYYTNKTRRKIMDYRAGQIKPDKEINEIFKL
jgi:predicted GNAT superfamily acetyltransferase